MHRPHVLVLLFVLICVAPTRADSSPKASLEIDIDGVRDVDGPIVCRLFDENRWLEDEVASARTTPGKPKLSFDGLSPGAYAVACFHDEDKNGKLTFGWFWRPKEGNCFSNGYRPLGPPKFKKASFEVSGPTIIKVELVYP